MKKVLTGVILALCVVLFMWGGLHVFLRPVNPMQKSPSGHFGSTCRACHFVSHSAKIVE
jgi:hypothetical protein